MSLLHGSGVRSRLWMNGMAAQAGPRFHVLGSEARLHEVGPGQPGGPGCRSCRHRTLPTAWIPATLGESWASTAPRFPSPPRKARIPGSIPSRCCLRGEGPLPVDPAESVQVLMIIEKIHAFA